MFRFTIRDLQWLTIVVGLAVGWWINRAALTASYRLENKSLYEQLEKEYSDNERIRLERDKAIGEQSEMHHRMEDMKRLNAIRDQPLLRPEEQDD